MKIIHTADWHLGKTLAGYDRTAEFKAFFSNLIAAIEDEKPNILIVAGDVFDTAAPSNAVANMYYNLVKQLHEQFPELHIVITSGNHDSPSYLNAPKEILHFFNVDVVGSVTRNEGLVDYKKMILDFGDSIVCAVPYLRRGDIVAMSSDNASVSEFYKKVLECALQQRASREIPIIGVGHLTTIGATYNKNSEIIIKADRDDSVGGIENIDPDDFPNEFSYIALGHIHRSQHSGNRETVRYSGSPIPFSFSEKDYNNSLVVVEFEGSNVKEIRKIPLQHVVKLCYVPEKLSDWATTEQALRQIPDDEEMFIEVNLHPDFRNSDSKARIINECLLDKKAKFCGFRLVDSNGGIVATENNEIMSVEQLQTADPMNIISDIYKSKFKSETVSDCHKQMLRDIIEELRVEN